MKNLVLQDIYNWKNQLVAELVNLEKEEHRMRESKKVAKQKIKEADELLDKMGYEPPEGEEGTFTTAPKTEVAPKAPAKKKKAQAASN